MKIHLEKSKEKKEKLPEPTIQTKKKYIKPEVKIFIIQTEDSITAGSANIEIDTSAANEIEVEEWLNSDYSQQSYL